MKRLLMQLSYAMTVCLLFMLSPVFAATDNTITEAEIDQMLAPIALYPDTVLTHILIASTYPLEVVQADRWAKRNKKLNSQQAIDAVEGEDWDPSVKALIAFPQILSRLSDDLTWTEKLGEAFLQDETQVLSRVQYLRHQADQQGNLNDTKHVQIERDRDIIIIEPARKEVIYVPVYDTRVVYGHWGWPSHPPVYWHNVDNHYSNSAFYWGASVNVNPWFYFGIFDWHHRHIIVNHSYYYTPLRYYPRRRVHFSNSSRWYHNHYHRRGVHYSSARLNKRYNGGYGPKQSTREYKGQPNKYNPNGQNVKRSNTREIHPVRQRRNAGDVIIPKRNEQGTKPVISRQDPASFRELRAEREKMRPVDRTLPVDRLPQQLRKHDDKPITIRRERPSQTVMPHPKETRQRTVVRQQRAQTTISAPVRQQAIARPAPQTRSVPERTISRAISREARPAVQRQTVTTRQRSID
ncbi:DUF3300 domain-containing protein [Rheinheimera sp. WS51]|uniref:DUF3300 domain-containing protein n=1 Tax=Rheinheimera sp. WS51 TaxID=3425886 RepID=UPI003D89DF3D